MSHLVTSASPLVAHPAAVSEEALLRYLHNSPQTTQGRQVEQASDPRGDVCRRARSIPGRTRRRRENRREACDGGSVGLSAELGQGNIKHVIYIQFDNTHFRRDNRNVPSDLEQMPHLLNFMTKNGTLLTNDHTVLISHTAGGILSSLTGVYPDRHGRSSRTARALQRDGLPVPELVRLLDGPGHRDDDGSEHGHADRAERAGAMGAVHERRLQLRRRRHGEHRAREHGHRASGDMTKVFGTNSPQWNEAETARLPSTPANARPRPAAGRLRRFAVTAHRARPCCANGTE